MNWKIFTDSRMILGFALSLMFEVIGIMLALKSDDLWVFFVVIGLLFLGQSVNVAADLYRQNSKPSKKT